MKQKKYLVYLLFFGLFGCSNLKDYFAGKSKDNVIEQNNPTCECRGSVVKYCDPQILFDFDSTKITDATKDNFEWVTRKAKNNSIKKIRIEAYCDIVGTEKYNLKLSKRRAEFIKQKLIGTDTDITSTTQISTSNSVKSNLSALDEAIGADVTGTNGNVSSANSINANLDALDNTIGTNNWR